MQKFAIAIHGGAGPGSAYINDNKTGYHEGLTNAITAGYKLLEKGRSALDAVEEAVRHLEDNCLFNAGRGSALNNIGEVEMDAAIMDGKTIRAGAVAAVKKVKNPVKLSRLIMSNTNHVLLCGKGALEFAKNQGVELEKDNYFVTNHQYDEYMADRKKSSAKELLTQKIHGTVGAVAVDVNGNVASATSTGGTTNCLQGRIGDSCLIGAGTYADNKTCAVSGTGDGEFLITGVIAHSIASAIEYSKCTVQQACDLIIHEKNKNIKGDIGVISVDARGEIGLSFNSERMHRAWITVGGDLNVSVY